MSSAKVKSVRRALRSAGFGRLAYRLWFRQMGRLHAMVAAGGPLEVLRTELGRREMEEAAYRLPSLSPGLEGQPVELHLLTGKQFWYQAAFCLWTFAHQSSRPLHPVIYDDGTLAEECYEPIRRTFPEARIVPWREMLDRLDEHLPESRFPILRDRWTHYPIMRKIIATHLNSTGWKLIVDSDLLFFRKPKFLLEWLEEPKRPLHAVDIETNYGYSRELLNSVAGHPVSEMVNAGLYGLQSESLDWNHIEFMCDQLIRAEGQQYYLEQALLALLTAGQACDIAPAQDYVTLPRLPEALSCKAVMHHYVADSKKWYFRHCWRAAIQE